MRICVLYDCLYPYSIGGAERWYRNLSQALTGAGHEVTYVTLRQWPRGESGSVPGVRVVAAGPRMALYHGDRRRLAPPLVFGLGVFAHLARHGRRYDVVHTASFPFFSVLAAASLRPLHRYRIVIDWHEVWTRRYWRDYLGPAGGAIGWHVQRACARVPHRAFCFSRLHGRRLVEEGGPPDVTVLTGEYAGEPEEAERVRGADPVVMFAGRMIPEKRAPLVVDAVVEAAKEIPGLRAVLFGDGPERARITETIAARGLERQVSAPGFVDREIVQDTLRRALCLLLPSSREGYGLVVVEAAAAGTPVVVVAGPDNAAAELVEDGENGFVVAAPAPEEIAAAIGRIAAEGDAIRARTAAWFDRNRERLSLDSSVRTILSEYAALEAA